MSTNKQASRLVVTEFGSKLWKGNNGAFVRREGPATIRFFAPTEFHGYVPGVSQKYVRRNIFEITDEEDKRMQKEIMSKIGTYIGKG